MKYKIIIKRILTEEYEMELDNDSIMDAYDEAKQLVDARNLTSKIGQFIIIKIDQEKGE